MSLVGFLWVVILAVVFIVGALLGAAAHEKLPHGKAWQREAVLKGHAVWAVDKDGAPVFAWKSAEAKP